MWKLTKQYLKDVWVLLWSKTEIDEKAVAMIYEVKNRYKLTTKELSDVAKGKKPSPSGKKDKNGKPLMVNNCVKIGKKKK